MTDKTTIENYYEPGAVLSDWARYVDCRPDYFFKPRSQTELTAILNFILQGGAGGRSLRILGGQHSCSDIFAAEVVIDPTALPLEFDCQPQADGSALVTASAFMHMHEFLARVGALGYSLTAAGGTDAQTLAGLISTDTAGATVHTSVYETLQWVEYLAPSPDGKSFQTQHVASDDPRFPGLVASLGAVGFLTRVGFKLPAQLYFTGKFEMVSLSSVVGDIAKTCADHDFWRIEWLPSDDNRCLMWTATPYTGAPPAPPNDDYPPDTTEALLAKLMDIDNTAFSNGALANEALILLYKAISWLDTGMSATGPMRNIIPCDRKATLTCAMAEWSFNPADLAKVMDVCRSYFKANKWPNLPVEIECTQTSRYWMSPWNWPGLPYIVKLNFQYLTEFLTGDQIEAIEPHLKGLWDALDAAGIPFKAHWGKINFLTPDRVARDYGAAQFMPTVSPMFMNDYLRRRLPVAS
jgi:FAD binding domain